MQQLKTPPASVSISESLCASCCLAQPRWLTGPTQPKTAAITCWHLADLSIHTEVLQGLAVQKGMVYINPVHESVTPVPGCCSGRC
jgi:hypothetical protein